MQLLGARSWLGWMVLALFGLSSQAHLPAEDWPTFRHDQRRSGSTPEKVEASRLVPIWQWQSTLPPQPAWPDSARWDAYAELDGLHSMRNYDPVFHPVVVGDQLFLGSNADDSVRCFSLKSGEMLWIFTASAPVRVAPTIYGTQLLFGSDDGVVYALNTTDGALIWSRALQPEARRFINDGRLCSEQPVRTGVLVDHDRGVAVVASGIFPWKSAFLYGLNLEDGTEIWRQDLGTGWTLEGAMLLGKEHLFAPQGRSAPQLFAREDGKSVGAVSGGGGSFVLLTDDDQLMHGPGNKSGWITSTNADTREKVASFEGGRAVVVQDEVAYLLSQNYLTALRRESGEVIWRSQINCPYEVILAGKTLFVGGDDCVAAVSSEDGGLQWASAVEGRAIGIAVANGHLVVSTDKGQVSVFGMGGNASEVRQISDALKATLDFQAISVSDGEVATLAAASQEEKKKGPAPVQGVRAEDLLADTGPEIQFVAPGKASVHWTMKSAVECEIELVSGKPQVYRVNSDAASSEHTWIIDGVRKNQVVLFRIKSQDGKRSRVFECDGHFDYTRSPLAKPLQNAATVEVQSLCETLELGQTRGMALVMGAAADAHFIESLAAESGLDVIAFAQDSPRVEQTRKTLLERGAYGRPVCVQQADQIASLPPHFANLIVVDPAQSGEWSEPNKIEAIASLLKPTARLVAPEDFIAPSQAASLRLLRDSQTSEQLNLSAANSTTQWEVWVRTEQEGSAAWSHMYGLPDNTAFAGESLGEAEAIDDLAISWCGRPGPRYQSDRGNRKPSPLAAGGRLYLQGLHRLIGLDAHNGTILWSHELPEVVRFNVPRDCSNWCADQENLFVAVRDRCKLIAGATGEMRSEYAVWNPTDRDMNWGFVARVDDMLLGSCVQSDASYTSFWGSESWYDAKDGELAKKVSSDGFFALDAATGLMRWNYHDGLILNPTISIGDGKIVFLECRSPVLLHGETRRLDGPELWENLHVVALNIADGQKLWESPAKPLPGVSALYGVIAGDKFLLQTSDAGNFAVYAMDLKSGKMQWRGKYDWEADHHGKHLSRPAVLDGKVYLRPLTLDLESGEVLSKQFPVGHQCGTYTASKNALFLRAGSLTMWDGKSSAATRWNRVRPDCWISTIPAEGMLLSPEGGGGCSCGGWIETSMGFAPKRGK